MHIEIGILSPEKIAYASAGATALIAAYSADWLKSPTTWLRTGLAAFFFSVLMQVWHLPIGPSELHMVGAMPIYLLLGSVPTLLGFGLGLLLQGLIFEPQDLAHLSINFLRLAVPLVVLHHSMGKKVQNLPSLQDLRVAHVLKLDAVYYSGVTLMVGFWLSMSNVSTPVADWAMFAASYLSMVLIEPVVTIGLIGLLGVLGQKPTQVKA